MSYLFHEQLARSTDAMAQLKQSMVTVCGAGALGGNIAETLVRSGVGQLKIIDCDRIEERNLSTQPYTRGDVGSYKAKVLANSLYRAVGTLADVETKRLTATNAHKLLGSPDLVIDAFDNSGSRQAVKDSCNKICVPCLHAGLAGDYAEVIWNDFYRVPSPVNDDVCDYPLARTLVMLTVAVATEAAIRFLVGGTTQSYTITQKDFSITVF
ncbi:MAG: ThiF family adenylyltransferase [Cyanobacteria bacterium J06642_11]